MIKNFCPQCESLLFLLCLPENNKVMNKFLEGKAKIKCSLCNGTGEITKENLEVIERLKIGL